MFKWFDSIGDVLQRWLYGNSVEDYFEFNWVVGRSARLFVLSDAPGEYEYQLYIDGDIPTKALHSPYNHIKVGENSEDNIGFDTVPDLNDYMVWGRRSALKEQCFYTLNSSLMRDFIEEHELGDIDYSYSLSELLSFLLTHNMTHSQDRRLRQIAEDSVVNP